jgi:hypothetical protein
MLVILGTAAFAQAQNFNNNYQDRHRRHILNKEEFAGLQAAVKKAPFADDKKNAFRTTMQNTFMTVDQLREFIKQIPFNDEKLDWAITAYPYTADAQRFYQLRESFSFISTQEKFDQFLLNMADGDKSGRHDFKVLGRDEFARLQATIAKAAFADDKKKVFKLALHDRYISVAQLSELIRPITFDDDKLDWARLAYSYTADTQRYYQLRDLFTFDSNKQKLDKFLLEAGE